MCEPANIVIADIKVPAMPVFDEKEELLKEKRGRLIIVSNRLSVTVKRSENGGEYTFTPSSGGLATGLAGMTKSTEFWWYGWPGLEVPANEQEALRARCVREHKAYPVFMSDELSDRHYNGFSNEILWPLFHYHPQEINFNEYAWEGYQEANRTFAKTVAKDVRDGDLVWVQDYHLMLLPAMLREELEKMPVKPRNVKIGFFLHTPFPSSETYRILPVRNEILEGVLHSDLIGFHTYDYVRHFLSACSRLMGLHQTPNAVGYQGKAVQIGAFPIGIEPQTFFDNLDKPKIKERMEALQQSFKPFTVIVGVDRLDYIKGIQQKLHALDGFLTEHPEWIGKIKLVQIAVPSRGEVEEYQNLRTKVNELIGFINGKFGTIEYQPVTFLHQSVSQQELTALYAISDVCLVTSTRDGMNLVSFEYIACQRDRHGVLVLSEFAGAAESLHGSLLVNPWDPEGLAATIHVAVTMSDGAREQNYEKMLSYVQKYTSQWWGESFVSELTRISVLAEKKRQLRARRERDGSTQQQQATRDSAVVSSPDTADTATTEEQLADPDKYANGGDYPPSWSLSVR